MEPHASGILTSIPTSISDTLIHVIGGPAHEYALMGRDTVEARQLTVVGTGDATCGVRAVRQGGGSASFSLDNSTVTGFANDLSAEADALSLASVSAEYSNYSSVLASPGGEINPGPGNIDVAPGVADPAAGNFHLRHDSPLVDAGAGLVAPEEGDLDELPRVVDGDAQDGPRPDIGAYEYQRAAPLAAISGPDSTAVGQAVELSGAGSSDADPADGLTYKWWFGDATTATGKATSHAYTTPGTHAITLQVTDPTGQQATATKEISVEATPPGGGGTLGTGESADSLAPVISRLRAARAGRAIRFRLSEPARSRFGSRGPELAGWSASAAGAARTSYGSAVASRAC